MDVTESVVCSGVDNALDDMCAYVLEGAGEDVFADVIAAIACGTAGNVACSTEFETNWSSAACSSMFGNDGCCGNAPPTNTCGTCPFDCVQLATVFPAVYNDDPSQAMTACQSVVQNGTRYYTDSQC
jgi:hypothetical protein